jgi:hypothetical protein
VTETKKPNILEADYSQIEARIIAHIGSMEIADFGPKDPTKRAAWKALNYHKHYSTVTTFKVENIEAQRQHAYQMMAEYEAYALSIGVKMTCDDWEVTAEQLILLEAWMKARTAK